MDSDVRQNVALALGYIGPEAKQALSTIMEVVVKDHPPLTGVHLTEVWQTAGTISQLGQVNVHPVQHRQPKIIERCFLWIANMAATFDGTTAATGQQDR